MPTDDKGQALKALATLSAALQAQVAVADGLRAQAAVALEAVRVLSTLLPPEQAEQYREQLRQRVGSMSQTLADSPRQSQAFDFHLTGALDLLLRPGTDE